MAADEKRTSEPGPFTELTPGQLDRLQKKIWSEGREALFLFFLFGLSSVTIFLASTVGLVVAFGDVSQRLVAHYGVWIVSGAALAGLPVAWVLGVAAWSFYDN